MQLNGCKYICNYLVAQTFFIFFYRYIKPLIFFEVIGTNRFKIIIHLLNKKK